MFYAPNPVGVPAITLLPNVFAGVPNAGLAAVLVLPNPVPAGVLPNVEVPKALCPKPPVAGWPNDVLPKAGAAADVFKAPKALVDGDPNADGAA